MKENKINLNEYKENYPNSQKSYKKVYDLNIPYREITISDTSGENRLFMFMILLVLTLIKL